MTSFSPNQIQISGNPDEHELAALIALLPYLRRDSLGPSTDTRPNQRPGSWTGPAWSRASRGLSGWKITTLTLKHSKRT